jgi:hypothetical protein
MTPGPNSPWCQALRTKKTIVSVCKAWWRAGIEFIYEEVVLRRACQVSALRHTLGHSGLGNLVKRIVFRCYVPSDYTAIFLSDMNRIFDFCPRASSLAYCDPFPSTFDIIRPSSALTCHQIFSTLTRLDCCRSWDFGLLIAMLGDCGHLKSLSFHIPNTWPKGQTSNIALIHLQDLRVHISNGAVKNFSRVFSWNMPALIGVAIVNAVSSYHLVSAFGDFCRIHGSGLKFLDLGLSNLYHGANLSDIGRWCPTLAHVVLPHNYYSDPDSHPHIIAHPTVQWVDFWGVEYGNHTTPDTSSMYPWIRTSLPALRGMRMFDRAFVDLPDLPTTLLPNTILSTEVIEYKFPGIHILCDSDRVVRMDFIREIEEEQSDDSSYEGSDDDDDSNDSSTESTSSEPDDEELRSIL